MNSKTKLLLGLFLVWAIGSTYWYTCNIKYLCDAKMDIKTPITLSTIAPATVWQEVKAKPLTVYFTPNSDGIVTEGVDEKLKAIVSYLSSNKDAKIEITGHTNYHRDTNFTEKLGLDRAAKLKSLLVTYGAPANSVNIKTMGQRQTIAPYSDVNAANLNRRAVISIISK
jgi:OmpA-OmpF porin, OOP family